MVARAATAEPMVALTVPPVATAARTAPLKFTVLAQEGRIRPSCAKSCRG
jgi:hypothetical protein